MNIGDIYAQTLLAATTAADLVLVSPDEYTGFTANDGTNTRYNVGFCFQIVSDEVASLQSDITDHYVENNSAMQDHISLKPKHFTVSGYVGELNNVITNTTLQTAKEAVDKLSVLSSYIPDVTNAALRAFNLAQQTYSLFLKLQKAANSLAGLEDMTAQAQAYYDLEKMWRNRTLFWVNTPFGTFSNMAIESLTATQSNDSKMISDFAITFKEVKFSNTTTTSSSDRINSAVTNNGSQAVA